MGVKLLSKVSGSLNSLATDKRAKTSSETSPRLLKQNINRIIGGRESSVESTRNPLGAGKLVEGSGAHSLYGVDRWDICVAGKRHSLLFTLFGIFPDIAATRKRLNVEGSNAVPAA